MMVRTLIAVLIQAAIISAATPAPQRAVHAYPSNSTIGMHDTIPEDTSFRPHRIRAAAQLMSAGLLATGSVLFIAMRMTTRKGNAEDADPVVPLGELDTPMPRRPQPHSPP